jgi:TadE-like protein
MVEFALLAPLFFLLVFGLADLARAVYYYNVISNASREGAREAILEYNACSNTSPSACGSGPPTASGYSSVIGVDNAVSRAGAGIVSYQFATDSSTHQSAAPNCAPTPNGGCVWVFTVRLPSGSGCTGPNPGDPNGQWQPCDFSSMKHSGNLDVVVEIEYQFVPLTPLVKSAMGANTTMWAKSEMRAEY